MGSSHIPKHTDCFASNACTGYTVRSYLIVHWVQALGKRQVCQGMAEFPLAGTESGPEVEDSCSGGHAEGCMWGGEQGGTGSDSILQHCCKSSLAEAESGGRLIQPGTYHNEVKSHVVRIMLSELQHEDANSAWLQ